MDSLTVQGNPKGLVENKHPIGIEIFPRDKIYKVQSKYLFGIERYVSHYITNSKALFIGFVKLF